ncbi:MAG TPA: ribonuclease HI [Longimicrobiales bacterium]|nr:ribonuclease HI [Longimicrobiales bacterium]
MNPLVHIYADESCLGNQKTKSDSLGGAGGLVEFWTNGAWVRRDYWISEPATTNNRMAIRSAIEGLGGLKQPCRVIFTSDSQYLVKGMREWIAGWVRRGWKRKTGPVENADLWKRLLPIARRHQVDWRWVRGHAGHPQNEYADHLATRAAREQTASGGLVESGFTAWLEEQREEREHYLDFFEFQPPEDERFEPTPVPKS